MKTDWLKSLAAVSSICALGVASAQTQTIFDFTEDFAPANWTLTPDVNGGYVEFCGCDVTLELTGPDRHWFDLDGGDPGDFINTPVRLEASVTIPFTATMRFSFAAGTFDVRGWGDGAGTLYESVGYSINGVDFRLSPDSGNDIIGSDDFLSGGSQYSILLNAGDNFSFYLESLDSVGGLEDEFGDFIDGGDAGLNILAFSYSTTPIPEPGEWVALAGVGLLGFAGVRRWRQAKVAANG